MKKTERLHSLDSLRAIMMLLGLVLHSSETYNIGEDDIWPRDPSATHIFQNYLNSLIHIFRMPIFFMIAGFFGAMLFYERSPSLMIKNRISRIVFPFIVFLVILHPIIISAMDFTIGSFGTTLSEISTVFTLLPKITYHLWFLYYLVLLTFFVFLVGLLLKRAPMVTQKISQSFEWLFQRQLLSVAAFTIIIFVVMLYRWDYGVPTPISFIPNVGAFLFFVLFYLIGWVLFKSKHLLGRMMKYDWLFTVLAFLIFTSYFIWSSYIDDVSTGIIHALITWLFAFGITGLFIRYGSSHSVAMRYVSDSSYWIFLIHLPLTIFIPGVIAEWPLPAFLKFIIVLSVTSAVCLATYHYLVRATFIGKFLNGRKYPL